MRYERGIKDSECSPSLPYRDELEIGDMVSVTNLQNNDRHTFIVVETGDHYGDNVCDGCDADTSVGCICVRVEGNQFDTQCAARGGCVFKLIDKMLEEL